MFEIIKIDKLKDIICDVFIYSNDVYKVCYYVNNKLIKIKMGKFNDIEMEAIKHFFVKAYNFKLDDGLNGKKFIHDNIWYNIKTPIGDLILGELEYLPMSIVELMEAALVFL